MVKAKKLSVHLVEHTHWDREWYFTSDDSRTMLYYNMKFMIDHLLKHDDKFTYDGQASIIDDFLKYAPDWKAKLMAVVKARKLYVGPFYTAVDNTVAAGESIVRNLEMGQHLAQQTGHSMAVGYLPDTFGHNNQTPQILRMNGLSNFSFYRGLDPLWTDNKLYFNFQAPDGSTVLGHWQTHYTTKGLGPQVKASEYTPAWFQQNIINAVQKPGEFAPSVESYAKRNFGLPIAIPIGTDQRPYSMQMPALARKFNATQTQYHFLNSSYEDFIKAVEAKITIQKPPLSTIRSELRVAKTGRVHRTVASSRADIKQRHYELEQVLINILEPMAVLCHQNQIDVPWPMIEKVWKDLHKSSAHDSYACSNEDVVNEKLENRLKNAIRTARGLVAMLARIYSGQLVSEAADQDKKLILFNYKHLPYTGSYQLTTTVKQGYDQGQFKLFDGERELKYSILDRNKEGTHERDALTLLIHDVTIRAFSHKVLAIEYTATSNYAIDTKNTIQNGKLAVTVTPNAIVFKQNGRAYNDLLRVTLDPSVGDTYDHSPLTFNDKKYEISNYQVLERAPDMNVIKVVGDVIVPSGIKGWKNDKPAMLQRVEIHISLLPTTFHIHLVTSNKAKNARMSLLVESLSPSEKWYHNQQFGIYERKLTNPYMPTWTEADKYGYKWVEYPTNLSPFQSFVSNSDASITVYGHGTKEHELISYNQKKYFSFTLYRAVGLFGTSNVAYRPGRASGAKCAAPDAQLIGKKLIFDFIIDLNPSSVEQQFRNASWIDLKNFYIPGQWALSRTLLRWDTNIAYYDQDVKRRSFQLKLGAVFKQFITTAVYKRPSGELIIRLLNVSEAVEVKSATYKMSRTLSNFRYKPVQVPRYGLINILLGEK